MPGQPGLDQLGDHLVAVGEAGVREHRHAAGAADDAHRLHRREPPARDVGGAAGVQVAVERLAHRLHVAAVRPSPGPRAGGPASPPCRSRRPRRPSSGMPSSAAARRCGARARRARRAARAGSPGTTRASPVHAVAEHVDLGARHVAVDLEAGHDLDAVARRLVHRLRQPLGGVVVGDGQHARPAAARPAAPARAAPACRRRRSCASGGRRCPATATGRRPSR